MTKKKPTKKTVVKIKKKSPKKSYSKKLKYKIKQFKQWFKKKTKPFYSYGFKKKVIGILTSIVLFILLSFLAVGFIRGNILPAFEDRVRQSYLLDEFNSFEIDSSANVYITIGQEQSIEVSSPENSSNGLNIEVKNNTIFIKSVSHFLIDWNKRTEVYITLPKIKTMVSNGSGGVFVYGDIVDNISIKNQSSGSIFVDNINVEDVFVQNQGSGDIKISNLQTSGKAVFQNQGSGDIVLFGKSSFADIQVSGSGDCNCEELEIRNAKLRVEGSGDAEIYVTNDLDVTVTGSGNVRYIGSPRINSSVTGSGSVSKK